MTTRPYRPYAGPHRDVPAFQTGYAMGEPVAALIRATYPASHERAEARRREIDHANRTHPTGTPEQGAYLDGYVAAIFEGA